MNYDSVLYRAKVSDSTTAVGSSAAWFKISEMGMPSSNPDYWATGESETFALKLALSIRYRGLE